MKKITIYSTPTCHFCAEAKKFLKDRNIAFTEHNVAADMEKRKEMIDKSGQLGVPVIDVDGQVMVGFEEASLKSLIGIK